MRPLIVLLALAPLGCISSPGGDDPTTEAGPPLDDEQRAAEIERRSSARAGTKPTTPERAPQATEEGVTGEVPEELLNAMQRDLVTRLSAGNANISVVVAEAVTWNDGSLGCPEPGRIYTQAIVPGYRVVLELAGQRYSYHADSAGYFVPCDVQLMLPPSGKTPTQ